MRIKEQTGYTLTKLAKVLGRNIDSIKQYSRINKLSESEKTYHIEQKSTKNDILAYLAKRELISTKELNESLFDTITTNPYDHLSKNELTKKIHEAESFLKIAKKLLKQEKTNTTKNDDTNKNNK